MVLPTKDNSMKSLTWLKFGNYLCFLFVKIIKLLWEPELKDLHKMLNFMLEEIKFQDLK
jgi:hypothetical protein